MQSTLRDQHTSISNFRLSDDIYLMGGPSTELRDRNNKIYEKVAAHGVDVDQHREVEHRGENDKITRTNITMNVEMLD